MANKSEYHERVGRKIQEIREKCGGSEYNGKYDALNCLDYWLIEL